MTGALPPRFAEGSVASLLAVLLLVLGRRVPGDPAIQGQPATNADCDWIPVGNSVVRRSFILRTGGHVEESA